MNAISVMAIRTMVMVNMGGSSLRGGPLALWEEYSTRIITELSHGKISAALRDGGRLSIRVGSARTAITVRQFICRL